MTDPTSVDIVAFSGDITSEDDVQNPRNWKFQRNGLHAVHWMSNGCILFNDLRHYQPTAWLSMWFPYPFDVVGEIEYTTLHQYMNAGCIDWKTKKHVTKKKQFAYLLTTISDEEAYSFIEYIRHTRHKTTPAPVKPLSFPDVDMDLFLQSFESSDSYVENRLQQGLSHRFATQQMQDALVSTGDAVLVYHTVTDGRFGSGGATRLRRSGVFIDSMHVRNEERDFIPQNRLGVELMKLRDKIRGTSIARPISTSHILTISPPSNINFRNTYPLAWVFTETSNTMSAAAAGSPSSSSSSSSSRFPAFVPVVYLKRHDIEKPFTGNPKDKDDATNWNTDMVLSVEDLKTCGYIEHDCLLFHAFRDYEYTYFLCNFYPSPITVEDYTYPTVEHAFQFGKFLHSEPRPDDSNLGKVHTYFCNLSPSNAARLPKYIQEIKNGTRANTTASNGADIGKIPDEAIQILMSHDQIQRKWIKEGLREAFMTAALLQKFKEGSRLAEMLIATHPFILVEHSSHADEVWTTAGDTAVFKNGSTPNKKNKLGKMLMEVRAGLMESADAIPPGTAVIISPARDANKSNPSQQVYLPLTCFRKHEEAKSTTPLPADAIDDDDDDDEDKMKETSEEMALRLQAEETIPGHEQEDKPKKHRPLRSVRFASPPSTSSSSSSSESTEEPASQSNVLLSAFVLDKTNIPQNGTIAHDLFKSVKVQSHVKWATFKTMTLDVIADLGYSIVVVMNDFADKSSKNMLDLLQPYRGGALILVKMTICDNEAHLAQLASELRQSVTEPWFHICVHKSTEKGIQWCLPGFEKTTTTHKADVFMKETIRQAISRLQGQCLLNLYAQTKPVSEFVSDRRTQYLNDTDAEKEPEIDPEPLFMDTVAELKSRIASRGSKTDVIYSANPVNHKAEDVYFHYAWRALVQGSRDTHTTQKMNGLLSQSS
jgi:predicted NAD-dependent protein-ADP-ribosyltransferase YbiA (DUF1768 family)